MVRTGVAKTQDEGWDQKQRSFSWNSSPSLLFPETPPPTPVSSEDYSLEPWGNSLLLVQTVLSVDPVSAYRRVRLTSQKTTKTGEASDFIFVFIFLNNEEWQ